MNSELEALTQRYIDGTISAEEMRLLNARLGADTEARREFSDQLNVDSAIAAVAAGWEAEPKVRQAAYRQESLAEDGRLKAYSAKARQPLARDLPPLRYWLTAATVGLLLGIFGTRCVSAFVSPVAAATVERLSSLIDAGFENSMGRIPAGFPQDSGIWSGDETEAIPALAAIRNEGTHTLRFVRPGADTGNPNGGAISCDVFQIVDLRPLRASLRDGSDAVLELSADFLDGRRESGVSITFICQIFLFPGSSDSQHKVWPQNLGSALGSGANLYDSGGGASTEWKTLTARCLVNSQADFAVVQLGARPNGPERELSEQYVDRVQLSLKVQPHLPVRNAKR